MRRLRTVEFVLAAVVCVAGIIFLVLPIAAIPDEALIGAASVAAAVVWIVQGLRSRFDQQNSKREREGVVTEYERKLSALAAGAPERLREALEGLRDATLSAIQTHLETIDPSDFERLVATVLEKLGFSNVVVTQSTRDHGIDVRASYAAGEVAPIDFCVQVKRTESVGSPDVQKLRGACTKGENPILVTSGRFTDDAVREAAQLPRVTLVSGERLAELLSGLGLGVRKESLSLHEPDLGSLPQPEQQEPASTPASVA